MRFGRVVRVVLVLISLLCLGFLSDIVSAKSARNHAVRDVTDAFAESGVRQPLKWVSSSSVADFYATRLEERKSFTPEAQWQSRLFGMTLYFPSSGVQDPWAYVRSESPRFPFVSAVAYGFVARPQYGHCGFRLYANFFGYVYPLADWPTWWT